MTRKHSALLIGCLLGAAALCLAVPEPQSHDLAKAVSGGGWRLVNRAATAIEGETAAIEKAAADEKAAIEQAIRDCISWAKDKDFRLLYDVIAGDEDFLEVHPTGRVVRGITEFKKSEAFWGSPDFKAIRYEIRDLEIKLSRSGEVAWFFCMLDDMNEWKGQPANWENTRWTGVLEKRDSRWVMVQQHFSFALDENADTGQSVSGSAAIAAAAREAQSGGERLPSTRSAGLDAERERIAAVLDSVIGWAKDKDLDRFFGAIAHDDDYVSVTPNGRVVKSFEDVNQTVPFWMSPDFRYVRHELRDLKITFNARGDVAWFYGLLDDINTDKGEKAAWENTRWTGVVEKRDGRWIVVSQHFSFAAKS